MVLNVFHSLLSLHMKAFNRHLLTFWMILMLSLTMDPSCTSLFANWLYTESKSLHSSALWYRTDNNSDCTPIKALSTTLYGLCVYLWMWILILWLLLFEIFSFIYYLKYNQFVNNPLSNWKWLSIIHYEYNCAIPIAQTVQIPAVLLSTYAGLCCVLHQLWSAT